ncbi:MAG TPA: alpha/beta fold hydrolase [Planctomycetaceae bacterium]|nr:alpha/beta fold hydrolase [Planctomycetaceae bacterium]
MHAVARLSIYGRILGVGLALAGCAAPADAPLEERRPDRREAAAAGHDDLRPGRVVAGVTRADESQPAQLDRNLTMKTLGGRQFWGDVQFFQGWRIQQNVFTRHYRLLDERDYRHASGTLEECRARLEELKRQLQLPAMSGKAVVFVHGIIRSSKSFQKLRTRFEQEGYRVFGFDYPSTRVAIPDAAEYLHQCLSSLEGIEEINLVVHSMGGLVVRTYLGKHQDPRIRRMVMIAVPNLGAQMADHLQCNLLFKAVLGPAGQQLVAAEDGYVASLPTPEFEFGILSGARGTLQGYNPLIPGDDDGTINVACTRLPGAADFVAVRALHSFLMYNDEAIEHTVRFIRTGRFREDGDPHPIPRMEVSVPAEPPPDPRAP